MKIAAYPELPRLAIAEGATTPALGSSGTGTIVWSTTVGGLVVWNGTNWVRVDPRQQYQMTFSVPGSLTTMTGAARFYLAYATVTGVCISVGTAPTGAAIIVDVNKNGSTIYTTQADRPEIAVSTNVDIFAAPTGGGSYYGPGDYITVDIDQVGSTVAGADLTVIVYAQSI